MNVQTKTKTQCVYAYDVVSFELCGVRALSTRVHMCMHVRLACMRTCVYIECCSLRYN